MKGSEKYNIRFSSSVSGLIFLHALSAILLWTVVNSILEPDFLNFLQILVISLLYYLICVNHYLSRIAIIFWAVFWLILPGISRIIDVYPLGETLISNWQYLVLILKICAGLAVIKFAQKYMRVITVDVNASSKPDSQPFQTSKVSQKLLNISGMFFLICGSIVYLSGYLLLPCGYRWIASMDLVSMIAILAGWMMVFYMIKSRRKFLKYNLMVFALFWVSYIVLQINPVKNRLPVYMNHYASYAFWAYPLTEAMNRKPALQSVSIFPDLRLEVRSSNYPQIKNDWMVVRYFGLFEKDHRLQRSILYRRQWIKQIRNPRLDHNAKTLEFVIVLTNDNSRDITFHIPPFEPISCLSQPKEINK